MTYYPRTRLRRNRLHPGLRRLVTNVSLSVDDLVYPLFIHAKSDVKKPITAMPGCYQLGLDHLPEEIAQVQTLNLPAVILFGIPTTKDDRGLVSCDEAGVIQLAIQKIKQLAPGLLVIADLCLCEYTTHGHCGPILNAAQEKFIDNDGALEVLAKQALSLARAGVDVLAPSGMMDGAVQTIRTALDANAFSHLPILSYAVKYASSLYGPFREAAEGAPQFGDRRSYQMDPCVRDEALRECALDIAEGADLLMVKPATLYLDIIAKIKAQFPALPLGAYHVSGEYAMIKAASERQWIAEKALVLESLFAIKRAGADFIITYYAKAVAAWLRDADVVL